MLVWRQYRSETGESWTVLRDNALQEDPADTIDSQGNPAMTMTEMPPADLAQLGVLPAARVADRVTGALWKERRYLLELATMDGLRLISETDYTWQEALNEAARLRDLSSTDAIERWEKMGYGNQLIGRTSQ